jgi:hypothetical protein
MQSKIASDLPLCYNSRKNLWRSFRVPLRQSTQRVLTLDLEDLKPADASQVGGLTVPPQSAKAKDAIAFSFSISPKKPERNTFVNSRMDN